MESARRVRPRAWAAIAALAALALDQISKFLVTRGFADDTLHAGQLAPFLDLALRYNRGVSFSLMRQDTALGAALLTAFSLGVVLWLVTWAWRARSTLTGVGIGLIVGGALGNAADRALYGAVVDFLDLHLGERHLFVFNVGDAAISAGVALLIVDGLLGEQSVPRV